jgi:predicted CXXCH cytochrome family protein
MRFHWLIFFASCVVTGLSVNQLSAKEVKNKPLNIDEIPQLIVKTDLSRDKIPSPHWKDNSCIVCHKSQFAATENNLRKKNVSDICLSCHDAEYDHHYIHPIDIKPSVKMLKRMEISYKKSLRKTSGKINCSTCHDISIQCEASKSRQKLTNPKFFRSGPFETRSQPCYFCHDRKQYKKLNPHKQLDKHGKIKQQKCRICHAGSIDKLEHAKSIKDVKFHAPADNLVSMCWGCHVWTPHPGGQFSFFKNKSGPNHLIKPTPLILKSLQISEKEKQIVFPLEPQTGKIFCATCHNPHQKGVIKNKQAAKGADSKRRLRDQDICQNCHNK